MACQPLRSCRPSAAAVLVLVLLSEPPGWLSLWQPHTFAVGAQQITGDAGAEAAASVRTLLSANSTSTGSSTGGDSGQYGYSALCVVGKNENRYVREWVEYHKCLGFSRIYMFDHNSAEPMSTQIADHIASGFVNYVNYSAAHRKFAEGYSTDLERFSATVQGQAYKHCIDHFGSRHTFLGFIDLDEFLVLHDESVRHVDELLRQYEAYPGLSVYWVLMGSSGHKQRPGGNVVDEYARCTAHGDRTNTQFKTFVNTRFRPTMYSPHRAVFAAPPDPATGLEPYMVDETFNRIQRGRNKNSTHTRVTVYHYITKSLEDFTEKVRRGGGAGVTRPRGYFDYINRRAKAICDGAQRTRQRFCGGALTKS